MALGETSVGVAPDSTGKKIRNLSVQLLQADGTVATVQMQVVAVVDEYGNPILVADEYDWRVQLLDEMRAVRIGLQRLLDAGAAQGEGQDDLLEAAQSVRDAVLET